MSYGDEQKKEIATIRPRKVELNLSDKDIERLFEYAGKVNLSVSELLQNFIGDLVDGTYSNGSNERACANEWYNFCWFSHIENNSLLSFLLSSSRYGDKVDVEEFIEIYSTLEDLQEEYQENEDNKNADTCSYDKSYQEFLLKDIERYKVYLSYVVDDYKENFDNENFDIKKEYEKCKLWFDDMETLKCV